MIYKVTMLVAMVAATAGAPTLSRRLAHLEAKVAELDSLHHGVPDDDVQADVADEVVAKFTKGKYASCAEVKEAELCGTKAAQAGCKATCADVEADDVAEELFSKKKKCDCKCCKCDSWNRVACLRSGD